MSKEKRLTNLDSLLQKRGEKTKLSKHLSIDKSVLSRLLNCKLSIENYKNDIYKYVTENISNNVSFDSLFAEYPVEHQAKEKPQNYDSEFARRVRLAIEKQKHFSGYKSDYEIVQAAGNIISIHSLSDYKNGYSQCENNQLEQLAITLNVIPDYLREEITLPYDYEYKELIEELSSPYSNSVYEDLAKAVNDFIFDLDRYAIDTLEKASEDIYFSPIISTDNYITEIIRMYLSDLTVKCKWNQRDIYGIAELHWLLGTPQEILQRFKQENNGLYRIDLLTPNQQAKLLDMESALHKWYFGKEVTIRISDLLILNHFSNCTENAADIKAAMSRYFSFIHR